jgi:hypothetical protein
MVTVSARSGAASGGMMAPGGARSISLMLP